MPSTVAIVQARMGSRRLPGKSLADLGGTPVIEWVLRRLRRAQSVDEIVLATSTLEEDDELAQMVAAHGTRVVRGHPTDVLDRFVAAVDSTTDADTVVRVTGDCPFVQPDFVDRSVELLGPGVQYVYTGHRGHLPRGFDVEAIRAAALHAAAREAVDPIEREHVTPFVARRPARFASTELPIPNWAQRGDIRLTVDERDDLTLLRAIVAELGTTPEELDGRAVISLLDDRPDLRAMNEHVRHSTAR